MENFRGKLTRDGQDLIAGIEGRLTVDNHPVHGPLFSGYFTVPGGSSVAVRDVYSLVLEDGRSCKIRIERVNATGQGQFASFVSEI